MQTVTCVCDEQLEIDPPSDLDLDENPQVAEEILEGKFMVYRCPKCETDLKLEFPFRIRSRSRSLDCFFIPEKNRSDLLNGSLPFGLSGSPQCIVGYPELVEKITAPPCEIAVTPQMNPGIESDTINWEEVDLFMNGEPVKRDPNCAAGTGWDWVEPYATIRLCDGLCSTVQNAARTDIMAEFPCTEADAG